MYFTFALPITNCKMTAKLSYKFLQCGYHTCIFTLFLIYSLCMYINLFDLVCGFYATGHVDPYQTYHKYHKYQVCENYFKRLSHQHYTQFAQSNFEKVTITSAKEKFLLKYIGPNVWTNIPLNIKNSMSLKVFINSYRIHLIGNYTDS